MYLKQDHFSGYTDSGQQISQRGAFLIMGQPDTGDIPTDCAAPIRCAIRRVALRQCGHWMMGRVNLGGRWYTVSGTYGGDGLPMSLPLDTYQRLPLELPTALREAWNKGGGWNDAGSEAEAFRQWALENEKLLKGEA